MMRKLMWVAGALACAAPLAAQDANYRRFAEQLDATVPPPPLDALRGQALAAIQGQTRNERRCVPTAIALDRFESASAVRAVTEGVRDRQLKNGWTISARAAGCGQPYLVRFFVLRLADDSLRTFIANEGETLANPSLIRDVAPTAAVAATNVLRRRMPNCTGAGIRMGPLRVVGRSADLGPNFHGAYFAGRWSEIWPFILCGHRVEIPVDFRTDGVGGADYDIHGAQARILD